MEKLRKQGAMIDFAYGTEENEDDAQEEQDDEDLGWVINIPVQHIIRAGMMRKTPIIPDYPAPPEAPPHTTPMPRTSGESATSLLLSHLKSSMGRQCTFLITLALFVFSLYGLSTFRDPVMVLYNEQWPITLATFVAIACLYTCVPLLGTYTGLRGQPTGWKPYLILYSCFFFSSIPALVCMALGDGAKRGFGLPAMNPGSGSVLDLQPNSSLYFEAADGYVALNLTKGITQTGFRTEHGRPDLGLQMRISRFRDAGIVVDNEPYADKPQPTVPPGATAFWAVAPVFQNWQMCETHYKIASTCLKNHPVVGWAIIKASNLCTELSMIACRPSFPELNPIYKCSTQNIRGRDTTGPQEGLCGRVVLPPREEVLDEVAAIYLEEGWSLRDLPNSTHLWLDISQDECIANPDACISRWTLIGRAGYFFAVCAGSCVAFAACLDDKIDRNIRETKAFVDRKRAAKLESLGILV